MSIVSVYAIFASAEEAERIGRAVVEERLAACINISAPLKSIYRWEGRIEVSNEVAALLKTHHWRTDALIERIAQLHSYAVPCIATWPIDKILGPYADWVEESVIRGN
jgi:periplasmic divalent cation tolerance protein